MSLLDSLPSGGGRVSVKFGRVHVGFPTEGVSVYIVYMDDSTGIL